jgi:hypothetical protein
MQLGGRFQASGSDAVIYMVQKWLHPHEAAKHLEGSTPVKGGELGKLTTTDNRTVERISKGEYRIFGTEIILKSNDPNAP